MGTVLMADEAVLGLFEHPDGVADALDALRAAGYASRELTVLSDSPYPEGAFDEEPVRHSLHVYPIVGAACGAAVGLFLTIGTQLAYPMVTGGKPLLSIPPMLVIIYCAALLGAMILTAFGVVAESRLPDFRPLPYDPRISAGYLGVRVTPIRDSDRRADHDARTGAGPRAGGDPAVVGDQRTGAGREDPARLLRQAGAVDVVGAAGSTGMEESGAA